MKNINYLLSKRFIRSESLKKEIEKTKKEKIYLSQQQGDEMHERLRQIR